MPLAREGAGSHWDRCGWGQVTLSPEGGCQGKRHLPKRCVVLLRGLSRRVKLLMCSFCSLIKIEQKKQKPPVWVALQGGASF